MNIFHLISPSGMYGAENVVVALARDLHEMGHSVRVGIFENVHCDQHDVADQMQARGVSVVRIPCNGRVDSSAVRAVRNIARSAGVEILHTHGYKADIYGYWAARSMGLPRIATCHLWTGETLAIRAYDYLDSLFLRRFDAVVAVSDAIAQEAAAAGIARAKIITIDNGIDLSPFLSDSRPQSLAPPHREGLPVIGTVGRLVSQKGMEYFVKAARRVLDEEPNVSFAVVGDGPDRLQLEELAKSLGIGDKVAFAGRRTDMPGVYAALDIFVLASLDEGMPMAILEALAAGCPVIATAVGAVPKLIVSDRTGTLIPPADAEALAQAMLSMIRSPELRRRLARDGRALVMERHSSQSMSRKYAELYRKVLGCQTHPFTAVPAANGSA